MHLVVEIDNPSVIHGKFSSRKAAKNLINSMLMMSQWTIVSYGN